MRVSAFFFYDELLEGTVKLNPRMVLVDLFPSNPSQMNHGVSIDFFQMPKENVVESTDFSDRGHPSIE